MSGRRHEDSIVRACLQQLNRMINAGYINRVSRSLSSRANTLVFCVPKFIRLVVYSILKICILTASFFTRGNQKFTV